MLFLRKFFQHPPGHPSRLPAAVIALLTCALLVPGLRAQMDSQPAATFTLTGTVVNSVTGEPIPHALVRVVLNQEQFLLTDSAGRFRFDDLLAGQATLNAEKPGFFNPAQMSESGSVYRTVKVGTNAAPVVLKLIPEGVISGRVTGPGDEPLEGFDVRLKSARIREGRKKWETVGDAPTSEDGTFRIAKLIPGTYYVIVTPGWRRAVTLSGAGQQGYRTTFYPGVDDLASASPLIVHPGETVEADLVLHTVPVYTVTGTVRSMQPGQGFSVRLAGNSGDDMPGSFNRFDPLTGAFEMRFVPAGSYTIAAGANDAEGRQLSARAPLVVAGDVTGIHLFLQPAMNIPVLVRTESPRPASSSSGGTPYVNVRLTSIGADQAEYYASPDGRWPARPFAVRGVEPGTYSVEISGGSPWYVRSAFCGNTDLLRENLMVVPGTQREPIEVVLAGDGGSIEGSVLTNGDETQAFVLAVPDRGRTTLQLTQFEGQQGRFTFDWLPPGGYTVLAFDSVDGLEYANRQALREYLSRGVHVDVGPNDMKSVRLQVITRGEQ